MNFKEAAVVILKKRTRAPIKKEGLRQSNKAKGESTRNNHGFAILYLSSLIQNEKEWKLKRLKNLIKSRPVGAEFGKIER